jgi:glycosyltransferase involved in cell wall biosynthesis
VKDATCPPTVSVLLCIHNAERFLASALDSALAQSYSDFELVAVDDGSVDGSVRIVESYRDSRVRLIRQDPQGAASALDTALCAARGEFVALLDHDDLWTNDKLAIHIETHRQRPEIDLTFSWFRVINDAGQEIGIRSNRYRGTIDFPGLLSDFVIGAISNVVIRRSAIQRIGGIDCTLPRLYDLDLCLRVALLAPRNVLSIERDLMLYRRHDAQITRDLASIEREWEQTLLKFEALAPNEFRSAADLARSNMDRYFARLAYEQSNYSGALKLLEEGWRNSPGHFLIDSRNWLTMAACASGLLLPSPLHRKLERLAGLNREGRQESRELFR